MCEINRWCKIPLIYETSKVVCLLLLYKINSILNLLSARMYQLLHTQYHKISTKIRDLYLLWDSDRCHHDLPMSNGSPLPLRLIVRWGLFRKESIVQMVRAWFDEWFNCVKGRVHSCTVVLCTIVLLYSALLYCCTLH